jgi:hypothetical protein
MTPLRRLLAAAMSACMLLALCACGGGQPQETIKPEGEAAMPLTMEYVLAHSDLTEADFAGVDFADFVAAYELTEADLEEYDLSALLSMYREEQSLENTEDYTVLYQEKNAELGEADLEHVVTLIWELHDGTRNTGMVIDGDKNAVYYGEGEVLSACGESLRAADLTAEDLGFVRAALRDAGAAEWQTEYKGTSEGTTGHFAWALAVRLDDGRTAHWSGSGVLGSSAPDTLRGLLEQLTERFSD